MLETTAARASLDRIVVRLNRRSLNNPRSDAFIHPAVIPLAAGWIGPDDTAMQAGLVQFRSRKVETMSTPTLRAGRQLAFIGLFAALFLLIGVGAAMAYPASTTADLNLRTGPGTQYRVIGSMPRGARVDVAGCSRGWCEVQWGGRRGYASERFLSPAIAPRGGGGFEIIVPFPGIGARPEPPPRRDWRDERPRRAECSERRVRRFVGDRATNRTVDRALDASRARTVRVVRPDDFITRDHRRDRLTIEVDRRNRIVDVRCY